LDIVAGFGNKVECCFDKVACCFVSVAGVDGALRVIADADYRILTRSSKVAAV